MICVEPGSWARRMPLSGRSLACLNPIAQPRRTADIAHPATVELSPSVTKRQCLVQPSQVYGEPIPADRSRHGERHRVIVNIAQGLRSGPSD